MPYNLEGRNVLVTGGSRGLGALVCKKFAAEGCSVAINFANREQPATELSDHLQKEYGVKTAVIHAVSGDENFVTVNAGRLPPKTSRVAVAKLKRHGRTSV
ncbi:MAG: hypothetical protein Q9157_005565 [Trypethelium eluteriae]